MTESKPFLSKTLAVDYPVSLRSEICKVKKKIKELKKFNAWLRSYPGDPDDTLQIRKDISKKISQANYATKEMQEAYQGKRKPITPTGFDHSMKLYCPGLWDDPFKIVR